MTCLDDGTSARARESKSKQLRLRDDGHRGRRARDELNLASNRGIHVAIACPLDDTPTLSLTSGASRISSLQLHVFFCPSSMPPSLFSFFRPEPFRQETVEPTLFLTDEANTLNVELLKAFAECLSNISGET